MIDFQQPQSKYMDSPTPALTTNSTAPPFVEKRPASSSFDIPLIAARPLQMDQEERWIGFRRLGRRKLADILHGIRLDVTYHHAEGAFLDYFNEEGESITVLDLLSGYGAGLLGHNPPSLVRVAQASLEEGLTMNAQASCRGWSIRLCVLLNKILRTNVQRDYLIHLMNTGSEVSEAAVRHAELVRRDRAKQLAQKIEANVQRLRAAWPSLSQGAQKKLQMEAVACGLIANPGDSNANRSPIFTNICMENVAVMLDLSPVFFALKDGYHGSGCASAQLSHGERYRKGLSKTGIDVHFLAIDDVAGCEEKFGEFSMDLPYPVVDRFGNWSIKTDQHCRVAGFFLEVIQGEGGVHEVPIVALQGFASLAKSFGSSLIVDEIQTGLGRTGRMFGLENSGLKPDIILLSKVLGGGMAKIGACAIARDSYHDDFSLQNISTFAEDDASSRIACGVLELLESTELNILSRVREIGSRLKSGLLRIQERWPQVIREVRGQGLMLGLEFLQQDNNASPMIRALDATEALAMTACGWFLHEHQVRVAPATRHARTLRIQPSACLGDLEIDRVLAAIDDFCEVIAKADAVSLTRFLHRNSKPATESSKRLELQHSGTEPASVAPNLDLGTSYGVRHGLDATSEPKIPRIAFLGHPIDADSVRGVEPRFEHLSDDSIRDMLDRMIGSPETYPQRRFRVQSTLGMEVDAVIHSWQPLPWTWMRARRDRGLRARLRNSIQGALEQSIEEGCRVVGFGAFTSIFTSSCDDVRNQHVHVTSGNGLTAGMADRAVAKACLCQGLDLSEESVAVVGATGNIGAVHALLLAGRVKRLILIGPDGAIPRLQQLRERIFREEDCGTIIQCSTDPSDIKKCSIVISATNTSRPLFGGADFASGPGVFLDVSVPSDLKPGCSEQRPDILFLKGGVVRLPNGDNAASALQLPGWHLPGGHVYACLAETLLLGLEDVRRDFSCGPLVVEDVREILRLADRHGFALGEIEIVRGVGA